MEFDEALQKKIAEALQQNKVATREDMVSNYPMLATLTPDYNAYLNPRVTQSVDSLSNGEVTHLSFIPMVDEGFVIVQSVRKDEPGAMEFARSESRRTGIVNMRAALNDFDLDWPEDRKLKMPVLVKELPVGDQKRQVVLFRVKKAGSKVRQTRSTKQKASQSNPNEQKPDSQA